MQIEIKKTSKCLQPGATYRAINGYLKAVTCNILISPAGEMFHVWERGDCESCDNLPKLNVLQFIQSPDAVLDFGGVWHPRVDGVEIGWVIQHEGEKFMIIGVKRSGDNFTLVVTPLGELKPKEIEFSANDKVEVFDIKVPKYPTIRGGEQTFKGYRIIELDFTDPEHFALCEIDGVMTWLPVDFN